MFLLFELFLQLDESMFVGVEVGQSLVIGDPEGDFVVTAFDANHCPGLYCLCFDVFFCISRWLNFALSYSSLPKLCQNNYVT